MLPVANLARARMGIDQAHRAVMLEDARHVLAQNRAARAQAQQDMQPGDASIRSQPEPQLGNIHVGDFYQTVVPQNSEKSTLSTLAKLGLAAALVVGGASLPFGAYGLWQALKPAVTPPTTDNDTQFELVIPDLPPGDSD